MAREKQMTEQKQEFLERLDGLMDAFVKLDYAWEQMMFFDEESFEKTHDDGKYPFRGSFDEFVCEVENWVEDLHEKLDN